MLQVMGRERLFFPSQNPPGGICDAQYTVNQAASGGMAGLGLLNAAKNGENQTARLPRQTSNLGRADLVNSTVPQGQQPRAMQQSSCSEAHASYGRSVA